MNSNDKLKILMGMDAYLPDVDGVINCMHNYCKVINDKTELLAIAPKNKRNYVDNFPYKLIRCKSFHFPILNQYYGTPKSDMKFKKEIFSKDFDIIHIHSPFNMGKFALNLARKKNIPIVATFHTNFRQIFKNIFKTNFITEEIVRKIGDFYNELDELFVCSTEVEKQARSFGYKGKISLVPFGTEFEKADNCDELRKLANKKFNLNDEEIVFLFVGRIMELKRIDFILDSLKILQDKGIKFKFYICGKGMYTSKLKAYSENLNFTNDEVIFTGFISDDDIKLIYARADLFLFPSLYDNFGLVKVEVAAFSTPCVLIKDSASAYGITDGVNGYLSENNKNAFAEKIIEAVSDKDTLAQIGRNAARDIYFNWNDCADILINKYKEVISRKKQS